MRALRRAAAALGDRAVSLHFPDQPLVALGDPVLFEHALMNVLENAGKHTAQSARIEIRGRREAGEIVLTVTDDGPGIAADDLPHVFDRFYRSAAGDRKTPGAGLGLAIAKGFVEALGGSAAAEPRLRRAARASRCGCRPWPRTRSGAAPDGVERDHRSDR